MTKELQQVIDSLQHFDSGSSIVERGGTLQRTQAGYTTAVSVQRPRKMSVVASNVFDEAKLAGASFFYRWEVFDKKTKQMKEIMDGSIGLAMCIARNFGNCALDIQVHESASHYVFESAFIDLENGFTCKRLFRQRKSQSISGKMDSERQEDIIFQIGQSKAQRNAIMKAIPDWLKDKAIEIARKAEVEGIEGDNLPLARANAVSFFAKYGILPDRIAAVIGRDSDHWTAEDIVNIRSSATALKEGRITADELYPPIGNDDNPRPNISEQLGIKDQRAEELRKRINADAEELFTNPDDSHDPRSQNIGHKLAHNEPPHGEAQGILDKTSAQYDGPWARENWVNLKKKGFPTFVYKNIATFFDAPKHIQGEAIDKWANMFHDQPWPTQNTYTDSPPDRDQGNQNRPNEKEQPGNNNDLPPSSVDIEFYKKAREEDRSGWSAAYKLAGLNGLYPKTQSDMDSWKDAYGIPTPPNTGELTGEIVDAEYEETLEQVMHRISENWTAEQIEHAAQIEFAVDGEDIPQDVQSAEALERALHDLYPIGPTEKF